MLQQMLPSSPDFAEPHNQFDQDAQPMEGENEISCYGHWEMAITHSVVCNILNFILLPHNFHSSIN